MAPKVALLKTIWGRVDERWAITGLHNIELAPAAGFDHDYFAFKKEFAFMHQSPRGLSIDELFSSFGHTDFLLKQSILPVVALVAGESRLRCIGTAFFVSCTGYVATACHVLLDPQDRDYGRVRRHGSTIEFGDEVQMGVVVPLNPAYETTAVRFCPFQKARYWGDWKQSPLLHEKDQFDIHTDIAICKVPALPGGAAHQPLNLSLLPFSVGESAIAVGYAEMDDVPIEVRNGGIALPAFNPELFVSVGPVKDVFPDNRTERHVPTPGPCFDFGARVPGKMSGAPIFGADGAVVRGVVSRSFSGEKHAYGAMFGPAMNLEIDGGLSLTNMMESGDEGIPRLRGPGRL